MDLTNVIPITTNVQFTPNLNLCMDFEDKMQIIWGVNVKGWF